MTPIVYTVEAAQTLLKKWYSVNPDAAAYRAWLAGQDPVSFEAKSG